MQRRLKQEKMTTRSPQTDARRARNVRVLVSATLLLAVLLPGAEDLAAWLIGRWRSLETSKGGIGAMYEFRKDGGAIFSPGAIVEASYRVEGSQLVLPPGSEGGPEERQTIEWLGGDRIRLRSATEPGVELLRMGSLVDAKKPIVGEWAGARDLGDRKVEVRYFFYSGGKALLLVAFLTQKGRYSLKDDSMYLELPNGKPSEYRVGVVGNILTISDRQSGRVMRFARY